MQTNPIRIAVSRNSKRSDDSVIYDGKTTESDASPIVDRQTKHLTYAYALVAACTALTMLKPYAAGQIW